MTSNKKKIQVRVSSFLYHEVTDDITQTGFQTVGALPYKHEIKEFYNNLDVIKKANIPVTLVCDINLYLPDVFLTLTFDDGGKSAMFIADAIEKYNWRGHFFITTSMIDSKNFLSKEEIRDLYQRGHVIGSHSHSHPDIFYHLSYEDMLKEWEVSRDILSEIIGSKVYCASIPGGEMNFNSQASACEAGFKFLFTSEPTLNPWKSGGVINFGRVYPKKGSSLSKVFCLARHKCYLREIIIRKFKNFIKKFYYLFKRRE